jgi:AcrR family transcriptional regulator
MATASKRSSGRPKTPLTREEILQIAQLAFAERGYAGASMRDIAERAGIRKSSLFHHFESKGSLHAAVFDAVLSELAGLLQNLDGSWLQQLDQLGDRVVNHLGAHPHVARLLMRQIVASESALEGVAVGAVEGTLQATATFLAEGMRQGLIQQAHAGQLAMSIIGLHLTWFAAPAVSGAAAGADIYTTSAIQARQAAVRVQIRRLCGAES